MLLAGGPATCKSSMPAVHQYARVAQGLSCNSLTAWCSIGERRKTAVRSRSCPQVALRSSRRVLVKCKGGPPAKPRSDVKPADPDVLVPATTIASSPKTTQRYVPPSLAQIALEESNKAWKRAARPLSSLKLAIGELAVIATLCAFGTFIEQGKGALYYIENYPDSPRILGFIDYDFILRNGLDHIYSTWYFLGMLALLGASLAACSSTTQWPMLKVARRWNFYTRRSQFLKLEVAEEVDRATVTDLAASLANRGYQVFTKSEGLYAFKGLVGRLAPIAVHVSLLAILVGSGYSALATINGTVMVPQGSAFDVSSAFRPTSWSPRPSLEGIKVLVNNFNIDTYESGAVAQFYSDLSVMDANGAEKYRKTISVNDPLRIDGVTAYQTDWSIAAVTVRASGGAFGDGVDLQLPMASLEGREGYSGRLWGSFLPTQAQNQRTGISILARDLESVVLYKESGEFAGVRRPDSGKPIEVEDITVVVKDIIGATGLELKMDPGVPFIYAGYGALIVTSFISYLSHSQVWAMEEDGVLYVGGRSNRAKLDFGMEINEVLNDLPDSSNSA